MPGWGHTRPAGSSLLFTDSLLWGLPGHTQHHPRCHPKGGQGRHRVGGWPGVLQFPALPPLSISDCHSPGLCLAGTLPGLAYLPTLETVLENIGSLPPALALLFFSVDHPDTPGFRTTCSCTYSGNSPLLLRKRKKKSHTNTQNQSKPSHHASQLGL